MVAQNYSAGIEGMSVIEEEQPEGGAADEEVVGREESICGSV